MLPRDHPGLPGLRLLGEHYVALYGTRFDRIVGTTRSEDNAAALAARLYGRSAVEMIVFDGPQRGAGAPGAITDADALLVSISPDDGADPVLARMHDAIAAAPRLATIVYLSTIAVYGNHDGG